MSPVAVTARVVGAVREGPYTRLALAAGPVGPTARPGQFVACAVGGPDTALVARRALAVAGSGDGPHGPTVDVVVAPHGQGTAWLAGRRAGDVVDVAGPLGRPFRLPAHPVDVVCVGGGYGTATLLPLVRALAERGCAVEVVVGAATASRLYGVLEARRQSRRVTVTTDDGSAGARGRVADALPEVLARRDADVVYACGPMPMLAAVASRAEEHGAVCQVAVEETMACGIGVCMTCVLPVRDPDGRVRMARACVEGPVLPAERVLFDAVGTVPPDAVGAPPPPPADPDLRPEAPLAATAPADEEGGHS